MPRTTKPLIFDGHNDLLSRLLGHAGKRYEDCFAEGLPGHIDMSKAQAGGLGAGFFAVFVSSGESGGSAQGLEQMQAPNYDLPLPEPVSISVAQKSAWAQVEILQKLDRAGHLRICTCVSEIKKCLADGQLAAVLHLEGAEAIGPDLVELDAFYKAGLRSLGPVWSRQTVFGDGVPFRFPASPDTGGGLTDLGRALVRRCNGLGIMVDVSHLTEAGFWDVAAISDAPLVATHSNAHALCPHSRNLTDRQLCAIAESGGMVGLNFATAMLRTDGRMVADTPMTDMIRHLDHLRDLLGEGGVALGSDFDGAIVPLEIGDASGLGVLRQAMIDAGYGPSLIAKICHENWLNLLSRAWG